MSKSIAESTFLNISVKDFVEVALGRNYWHDRPIPASVAEILLLITKNNPEFGCHVQTRDEQGEVLDEPVLWKYSAWVDSHERFMRQKEWSRQDRVKRFIWEANVKIVEKRVNAVLEIRGDAGRVTAMKIVNKNERNKMRFLGVEKLITKEEEL